MEKILVLVAVLGAGCVTSAESAPTSTATEIEELRQRLAVVETALRGAPDHSNTFKKVAARHDLLSSMIEFQESVKSNWWCSSFICFRGEAMCNAVEQRGAKPGEAVDKCMPRRNVFCRGIGLPLLGEDKANSTDPKRSMSCHAILSECLGYAQKAGGTCMGIE